MENGHTNSDEEWAAVYMAAAEATRNTIQAEVRVYIRPSLLSFRTFYHLYIGFSYFLSFVYLPRIRSLVKNDRTYENPGARARAAAGGVGPGRGGQTGGRANGSGSGARGSGGNSIHSIVT
jgi:hypothetical protein